MTTPSTGSVSTKKTRSAAPPAPSDGRAGGAAPWAWPSFAHSPSSWPGLALAARPGLLVLAVLLLAGLGATLAARGVHVRPARAENTLLAVASSSKLKNAPEAPPKPPAAPAAPKHVAPEAREPLVVAVANPAPVPLWEPPERSAVALVEPRLLEAPAVAEPVVFEPYFFLALHQGDSPMIRKWTLLGLPAFMAVALAAGPSPAAEPLGPVPGDRKVEGEPAGKLADISNQLEQIRKAIADLVADQQRLKDSVANLESKLEKDLVNANKDILDLRLRTEKAQGDIDNLTRQQQKDLDGLRQQLSQIQKDLEELKKRPASSTVSSYPTPATPSTGRVVILNTYPDEVTVVVNQKAYKVKPGETRLSEPIAAGPFTYEVLNVQESRNRTMAPNGIFTVSVYPQTR